MFICESHYACNSKLKAELGDETERTNAYDCQMAAAKIEFHSNWWLGCWKVRNAVDVYGRFELYVIVAGTSTAWLRTAVKRFREIRKMFKLE